MRSTSGPRGEHSFWGSGAVKRPSLKQCASRAATQRSNNEQQIAANNKQRSVANKHSPTVLVFVRLGEPARRPAKANHNDKQRIMVMATQSYRERMAAARAAASAQRKAEKAARQRQIELRCEVHRLALAAVKAGILIDAARKRGRNGPRDAAAILLAYRHGLRAAELCQLRWAQVNLRHGQPRLGSCEWCSEPAKRRSYHSRCIRTCYGIRRAISLPMMGTTRGRLRTTLDIGICNRLRGTPRWPKAGSRGSGGIRKGLVWPLCNRSGQTLR
jgi:hypothetical protein